MEVHFFDYETNYSYRIRASKKVLVQIAPRKLLRHLKKHFLWRSTSSTMRPTTGTGS
jgi:hypothetical protein